MRIPLGNPLQILLLACSFALAGYAGVRLLADDWFGVALWFVGAAVVHDLVLLPLYAAADRALVRTAGRHVLYVRVPAAHIHLRENANIFIHLLPPLVSGTPLLRH